MRIYYPSSLQFLLPIIFGIAAFFLVVGFDPLIPNNLAWLSGQDPSTHYLGWAFFRHTPWSWPLGLNPNYGLAIGSSIVFSDSIPLLAFFFKPFASILPEPFQYIGIWVLLCFIFQAWFSWKLAELISDDWRIRILICGLLGVFAPPFLKRLGLHASLMGQFVILASLYLNLRTNQSKRLISWLTLVLVGALINIYLFSMICALWAANLIDCRLTKTTSTKSTIAEISVILFCALFCLWQAGYFLGAGSPITAEGFGQYKLNVLSLFDPGRYSYILKSIPHPEDLEEGFNFLGLGFLILIPFVIHALLRQSIRTANPRNHTTKPKYAFLICIISFCVFALSNQISIGPWSFSYTLPDIILQKAAIFRSSGRFFWPAFYLLTFYLLKIIITRYSKRAALLLLLIALITQIIDTSAGWLPLKKTFANLSSEAPNNVLQGSFWEGAGTRYRNIVFWPLRAGQTQEHWQILSFYAAHHQMGTNAVYLGRPADPTRVAEFNKTTRIQIETDNLAKDTLYILDNNSANHRWLSGKALNSKNCQMIYQNLIVIIPNWPNCNHTSKIP